MPRERRRLVLVAGFAVAVAVALATGPVVDGRRWEAGRPIVAELAAPERGSIAPLGRRWD